MYVIWIKLLRGTGQVTPLLLMGCHLGKRVVEAGGSPTASGAPGRRPDSLLDPETRPRRIVILVFLYRSGLPFCFPLVWPRSDLNPRLEHRPSAHAQSPRTNSTPHCSSGHAQRGRPRAGGGSGGGRGRRAEPAPPACGGFSLAEPPPQLPSPTLDWPTRSRWAWPPGGGRERKESALSREAGLPRRRRGRARGVGKRAGLLNDKSAGDCWGPAPGGGEGEGGAVLRAAGPVRTAEAARDGSQVSVPAP